MEYGGGVRKVSLNSSIIYSQVLKQLILVPLLPQRKKHPIPKPQILAKTQVGTMFTFSVVVLLLLPFLIQQDLQHPQVCNLLREKYSIPIETCSNWKTYLLMIMSV